MKEYKYTVFFEPAQEGGYIVRVPAMPEIFRAPKSHPLFWVDLTSPNCTDFDESETRVCRDRSSNFLWMAQIKYEN